MITQSIFCHCKLRGRPYDRVNDGSESFTLENKMAVNVNQYQIIKYRF